MTESRPESRDLFPPPLVLNSLSQIETICETIKRVNKGLHGGRSMNKAFGQELPQEDQFALSNLRVSPVSHLDFENTPAPNSSAHLKSSSLESLISQNEDLMARLKVTLRRLSLLEIENEKIVKENQQIKSAHQALSDKYLVFQEKDNLWKERLDALESEREKYIEQYKSFQSQLKHYQAESDRFQKYQEKIKLKVKPYIEQLKTENADLSRSNRFITLESEKLMAEVISLRGQVLDLSGQLKIQLEEQEQRHHTIIESYENEVRSLRVENEKMKEESREFQLKSVRLSEALLRKDQLENEVVEMKRLREEMIAGFENEIEKFKNLAEDNLRKSTRLELEQREIQDKLEQTVKKNEELQQKIFDLSTQNESLSYLWKSKTEETERLKISIENFEKLNVELSSKVSELRNRLDQAALEESS